MYFAPCWTRAVFNKFQFFDNQGEIPQEESEKCSDRGLMTWLNGDSWRSLFFPSLFMMIVTLYQILILLVTLDSLTKGPQFLEYAISHRMNYSIYSILRWVSTSTPLQFNKGGGKAPHLKIEYKGSGAGAGSYSGSGSSPYPGWRHSHSCCLPPLCLLLLPACVLHMPPANFFPISPTKQPLLPHLPFSLPPPLPLPHVSRLCAYCSLGHRACMAAMGVSWGHDQSPTLEQGWSLQAWSRAWGELWPSYDGAGRGKRWQ